MKKILIIDKDQIFISNLQAKLAQRYDVLATKNLSIARKLLEILPIHLLLVRQSQYKEEMKRDELYKILKKFNKKNIIMFLKLS